MKHSQVQHALVNFVQRMRLFILNFGTSSIISKTRSPPATAAELYSLKSQIDLAVLRIDENN